MITKKFFDIVYVRFERAITILISVTLMLVLAYATFAFLVSLYMLISETNVFTEMRALVDEQNTIEKPIERIQRGLFNIFGGFLLILLGIELIGTMKYFAEKNHIKIESIVAISIIATSRHLITLDFHHTEPAVLFAVGFISLSLLIGYYLIKRADRLDHRDSETKNKSLSET